MAKEQSNQSPVGIPVGSKIGKYEVRQRMAIGGQAIIYRCHDPVLDRYVAIKQISTHLAEDPKFLDRFRREAQILAKLGAEQPAIVTIHDLIEEPRGLFLVMEYVPGNSLETILRENEDPVEPKAVLQIIWRLAAGLHAVHAMGIVHRDIKPANIIIGESLRAKITDFGVAASITGQTSMLLGTTKYMAPELFTGQTINGRADMYSLGLVAYEMLAGRRKFNEVFADVVSDKHSEALRWMKWHGNPQVQAPPLHELNPSVPKALSDIVAKMMSKDVNERFQSMEALGRAIKAGFSPKARAARPEGMVPPAPSPAIRVRKMPAALEAKEAIGPGDEADQLELMEGPPTTRLPKAALSMRTRLILSGLVAAGVIAIGVIAAVRLHESDRMRQARASGGLDKALGEYRQARDAYDAERFKSAVKAFQSVAATYKGTEQASKAGVLAPLAQAHLAVLQEDWDKAQKARDEATQQVGALKQGGGALAQWAGEMQEEIATFDQYLRNSWRFVNEIAVADEHLGGRRFAEAQKVLDERLAGIELKNPALRARLESFQSRLKLAKIETAFSQRLADGDAAVDRGGLDQAQAAYQAAEDILAAREAEAALGPTRKQQLADELQAKRIALNLHRSYQQATSAAQAARDKSDKQAELKAMEAALKVRDDFDKALRADDLAALEASGRIAPLKQLRGQVQDLRAEIALAAGLDYLQQAKYDEAIKSLQESIGHKQTEQAGAALERARKGKQLKALLEEARADEQEDRLDKAAEKYKEAVSLKPEDEELQDKLRDLRYELALREGRKLRDLKKYAEAAAAYEQARQIKPQAAADIDALLAAMRQQESYEGFIAQGDEALAQKKWAAALGYFNQAKALMDTEEVKQRIILTRYSEQVASGKARMDQADYRGAKAYFRVAQDIMDTEEVRKLIAEADRLMKE